MLPFVVRLVFCFALAAMLGSTHALALNPAENPSDYIVNRWDAEDGLPHNSIRHLFQTSDGYLWVGTTQGLARFDGLTFTVFNQYNTPGFVGHQITSMAETSDGSLWIGTSLGLVRYYQGKFTNYRAADGLKVDTVNAVCVAPDGSLWIGGREGITRWVNGRLINDISTTGLPTAALRTLSVDRRNAIWVASGTEAWRYDDGKFTRFGRAEGLSADVQSVREDAAGRIIAVTQNGLHRLEGDRFIPVEYTAAVSSPRVGTALADRAGNFWIGTVAGLDRFSDNKIVPYTDRNGNKLGAVDTLFEDREGCLWVGTSAGLYRFNDRRGYSLTSTASVGGAFALTVQQTRDNSLWISTWAEGIERFSNGAITKYKVGAPLSHETITAIYEAADGVIWLGTRGSALDRLEGGRVTTFVYQPGVATSRPVTAIHIDADGEFLLGISRRGLLQFKDDRIMPVPEATALAQETVTMIQRTRQGRLLIGTSKGLYERLPDRTWQLVNFPGLEQPVVVRALLEEENGVIWLATEGHGLVHWTSNMAHSYRVRNGMVDDTLFSIVDDQLGALWVSSARGMARIRKTEFDEVERGTTKTVNSMTFGRVDGLLSAATSGGGTPAALRLNDGRIMTTTDKGVAVIDPRALQVNSKPPAIVIESVIADDQPLSIIPGSVISVPSGTHRLEFRYTALSLLAPQRLRFRYQLEGSDLTWVEAGRERSVRYTHLDAGSYVFHVLACNNDGVWNDTGATIAVNLLPRFYQTFWFRLVALGFFGSVFIGAVGLRVRQLKRREEALARSNAELDQRVRERTAELSRSHAELQQRELLFRLIFEHAPVGVSWSRSDLGGVYHFNSAFRRILDLPADTHANDSLLTSLAHPADALRQSEQEALIRAGKLDSYALEQRFVRLDGQEVSALLAVAVVRDQHGQIIQVIRILEDISALKRAQVELANTYKRLMEASRVAGMAEVATGVLHNVGNVLNSVNVSVAVLADGLHKSRVGGVSKVTTLLNENAANLPHFLTADPRGQRVLPYLDTLADHLAAERERFLTEVESLRANVEHIKEIVSRQQAYAQLGGLTEELDPSELAEDALRMNAMAFTRHGVEIVREFSPSPKVAADRHKVLQILINLVQNAKQAVSVDGVARRRIVIRITTQDESVFIAVSDSGVGIAPENLTKIFEHGFTTRANGHGFGLHSAANAAREMHGQLAVHSDGCGKGATFTLQLPIVKPVAALRA